MRAELWKTGKWWWEAQAFPLQMWSAGIPLMASALQCRPWRAPGAIEASCCLPLAPLAAVLAEACEAAVYFQSERAPHHFSISDRRVLHRALVSRRLLASQFLIPSGVPLMMGNAGGLLRFTPAVHLVILPSVRCSPFPQQRKSAPLE